MAEHCGNGAQRGYAFSAAHGRRAADKAGFQVYSERAEKMGLMVSINSNASLIDKDMLDFSAMSRRSGST